MTRKKKTKPQPAVETEPTELTPETPGQPEPLESFQSPTPESSDQSEPGDGATVVSVNDEASETPSEGEPVVFIETIETDFPQNDGAEALDEFDSNEPESEEEKTDAEIVSVSPESSDASSEETEEVEISPLDDTAETDDEQDSEDETPPEESAIEAVESPEEEAELSDEESVESETPDAGPDEEGAPSQPSAADVQALDFQAAFRRAFQQPEDEELEAEPSEIEQETADVENISGEPLARTPAQIKAAAECLLFTTPSPLGARRMANIIGGIDLRTMRGVLGQLQAEYDARGCGIQIIESAEGFQMCTRPEYATAVMQLHRQRKKNPLSPTALETLAIVAYKQPLTRAEIEMIRGVECSGVVRNLCDLDLIKVVGRKEVIGRPQLYGTTARFLQTFGLKSIEELPSIQNLRRRYALDGDAPAMSVSDLMQQAQAARAEAMESEEPVTGEEAKQTPEEAMEAPPQSDAPVAEALPETPDQPESEDAGVLSPGDIPMLLNREQPLEETDVEDERWGDDSEETGNAPDMDIPEEDEAEMDEAEETLIADEEDEMDEDEDWEDGKDEEDWDEDDESDGDEEEDEEDDWDDDDDEDEEDDDDDEEEEDDWDEDEDEDEEEDD
jgi:segregation and condensation protein B